MSGAWARVATVGALLPRPEILLGWLVVLHVLLKLVMYPLVMEAPPFGDEQAYVNGAMALSNAVRDLSAFTAPDTAELDRNVVASGWFMPGMSIVLTPLYVVFPDADPALFRGYLGVVSLIAFVLVLRYVARRIGYGWACVVAAFPGLVPSWVLFSFGAWGDLGAGLLLLVLLVHVVVIFRGLRRGEAPSWQEGLFLGLIAIALLYLRSSTSVLLAGLGVITLTAALVMLRGRARGQALGAAGLAAAVFVGLLVPWSAYASRVLDAPVVTTTTVPTSLANTFGDESQVCFGECDPDSTLWFRPVRYAREVGRATGTSEVEVLQVMSDHALRDLTPRTYLEQVDQNLAAYAFQPAVFFQFLEPVEGRGPDGSVKAWQLQAITWLLYFPLLLCAAASMVTVARRSLEARVLDVLVKVGLGSLLVQPFVHVAGGRYWASAAPLFALAAVTHLRERQVVGGHAPPPASGVVTTADATIVRWLGRIQVVLASATGLVAVVLLVAAVAALVRLGVGLV